MHKFYKRKGKVFCSECRYLKEILFVNYEKVCQHQSNIDELHDTWLQPNRRGVQDPWQKNKDMQCKYWKHSVTRSRR